MKRRNNNELPSDERVIDLTKDIDYTNIYIPWPSEPLQMTLCAGDGVQLYNDELKTDIEYFTREIKGFNRETKKTNIFCCSPDYNTEGLRKNIEYLNEHRELKILLVLCDTTNSTHLENFKRVFLNKLTVIQEDIACYGGALSYDILNHVLVPGGKYILDNAQRMRNYLECDARFEIKHDKPKHDKPKHDKPNKLIITKKIVEMTTAGTKTTSKKRNNRRKSHRKLK